MEQFKEKLLPIINQWFFEHGIKVLVILIVGFLLTKISRIFIEKIIRRAIKARGVLSADAETKREDTLISIFSETARVVVWILTAMLILSEIGIDIAPLIAGAGIIGLAFGFGGQYLIKDLISGFFIILENQYRIGDVVCFDTKCGLVEGIRLRTTTLRDLDGIVHHVPNGEIKIASNLSKVFSRVNLNIGVSYSADLEKVEKIVNETGNALAKDPKWKDLIISPPQFLRVDEFADSAVVIKILGDTQPLQQWSVTGELRKRIKVAFDKEGIEIPFPQVTVHQSKKV